MKRETAKRLLDASVACEEIAHFTSGRTRDEIGYDRGLPLIQQKLVSTIGEALGHVRQTDPGVAQSIPDLHRIIGMRNQIVHGYDSIDYAIVWRVATGEIPRLATLLASLLEEAGPAVDMNGMDEMGNDIPDST